MRKWGKLLVLAAPVAAATAAFGYAEEHDLIGPVAVVTFVSVLAAVVWWRDRRLAAALAGVPGEAFFQDYPAADEYSSFGQTVYKSLVGSAHLWRPVDQRTVVFNDGHLTIVLRDDSPGGPPLVVLSRVTYNRPVAKGVLTPGDYARLVPAVRAVLAAPAAAV